RRGSRQPAPARGAVPQRPGRLVPATQPRDRQRSDDRAGGEQGDRRRSAAAPRPAGCRRSALPAAGHRLMAPRLAVNFSPALASLVQDGSVTVDVFKVPDWDDLIAAASAHGPVYVHFPVELGATKLGVDLGRSLELLEATGTTHLNAHVVPSRERFPDLDVDAVDEGTLD